jgi:hypothetical protein
MLIIKSKTSKETVHIEHNQNFSTRRVRVESTLVLLAYEAILHSK